MIAPRVQPFTIRVNAIFGSPHRRCAGSGLCKLLPESRGGDHICRCPALPATLKWHFDGSFELILEEIHESVRMVEDLFCNERIFLEAPFVFPSWLCRQLHLNHIVVAPGHYPAIYEDQVWRLFFVAEIGFSPQRRLRKVNRY